MILLSLLIPPIVRYLNKPMTCSDGVQNQGETAIDLGGPCHYLNPADLRPLTTQWANSFKVTGRKVEPLDSDSSQELTSYIYSAVAYVENPNIGAGVREARYTFKLYDEKGIYITEKSGETFIPPSQIIPIFEGDIEVGLRKPFYTKFSFDGPLVWEKMRSTLITEVSVDNESLKDISTQPRLSAEIHNNGVYPLRRLVVVATLFNNAGNAIGASRTIIDKLAADSTKKVVFTWPDPFKDPVTKIDIVPLLPPVDSL